MNLKHINVGIIHSLIGKNDGVSIVIDQTVNAMVNTMGIALGNIYFLGAHSSPRFNAETNDVFWHKSDAHNRIIHDFQSYDTEGLEELITTESKAAKAVIEHWIEEHNIDLIIAHNTSHPYNFITAVGLGLYIEERRGDGIIWPKLMVWWHDSYFERPIFQNPNPVIKKYLKYLPGDYIDGLAFINHSQIDLAKSLFKTLKCDNIDHFFEQRTTVVPNTSDIPWNWETQDWEGQQKVYPKPDNYNKDFFNDIGLIQELESVGMALEDSYILLQHTRVVPRKRIEVAIDLAFRLEQLTKQKGENKCIVVLVSGHSGDEQEAYMEYLEEHYNKRCEEHQEAKVLLLFGENSILSHRDIIVDKKYYSFKEIPAIVAEQGGIGTYFSDIEGFGNNLLEMIAYGLPAVINRYDAFKTEIETLGFKLPYVDNCELTDALVETSYQLLSDTKYRNSTIHHNLKVLRDNLDHNIIAKELKPLFNNMFTRNIRLNSNKA